MTVFGKVLVFLNLVLSLLAFTWALGLYTNNVDWSDIKGGIPLVPAKGGKALGLLAERQVTLASAAAGLRPAEASYLAARNGPGGVLPTEEQMRADRDWYRAELAWLRTGDTTAANPARAVKLERLLPVPDPRNANRPTMEPAKDRAGQPLLSLRQYNQRFEATLKEVIDVMDQYVKAVNEDIRLTDLLAGTGGAKGLQQRLVDERAKREGVEAEGRLVRPLLVNVAVDYQLVAQRQTALQERINELRGYLKKRHRVDVAVRDR
jgi:hypothetical protein